MTDLALLHEIPALETSESRAPLVLINGGQSQAGLDRTDELWTPSYGLYDREVCLRRHEALADLALATSDVTVDEIERGSAFIHAAFDAYEGKGQVDDGASFAFCVPTRTSDLLTHSDFSAEVTPFFPVLGRLDVAPFYVERLGTALPPTVIERHQPNKDGESGVVLYSPISPDIVAVSSKLGIAKTMDLSRRIVDDTVSFATNRLGARAVGLGATLPALTKFGQTITSTTPEMAVTTGHAGTVYLIAETVDNVMEGYVEHNGVFGIIGCGSIGQATAAELQNRYPNARFAIHDTKAGNVRKLVHYLGADNVIISESADEVIEHANITISAVTSDFDLPRKNYAGKAVIEDSMPTHVPQDVIEDGGGIVAWVIGDDETAEGILTPKNGYTYGGSFVSETNTFGCAAEVAVISESHDNSYAVTNRVTPEDVQRIGSLFRKYGIVAAELQRSGLLIPR